MVNVGKALSSRFKCAAIVSGWIKYGDTVWRKGMPCRVQRSLYLIKERHTNRQFNITGEVCFSDGTSFRDRFDDPHNSAILRQCMHYTGGERGKYILHTDPDEALALFASDGEASTAWPYLWLC